MAESTAGVPRGGGATGKLRDCLLDGRVAAVVPKLRSRSAVVLLRTYVSSSRPLKHDFAQVKAVASGRVPSVNWPLL